MREFFLKLGRDIRDCYRPTNLLLQLLAVFLTYLILNSGLDWYWFTHTRNEPLQQFLFPAAVVGGLLPIVLPLTLYLIAKIRKSRFVMHVTYAVTEAALLALTISSFYKVFTGRIPPPFRAMTLVDTSHGFNFGFFRDGIFWGWPSSHTTIAFAMAVTIFILYRRNTLVRSLALAVAFYIGIGVSTNIHWLSEFVAGAIIGSVIGTVVGKRFMSYS